MKFIMLLTLIFLLAGISFAQTPRLIEDVNLVPSQPFKRFFTNDKDRRITFYVSESITSRRLPLAVFVQGSGCSSVFRRVGERIYPNGGYITLAESLRGRAHFLVVEKPGVDYLDSTGDCRPNKNFNKQHTLEAWSSAIVAAVSAIRTHKNFDASRTLITGHSEGGLVAARVGRLTKASHIALIAGGGVSQLYDLEVLARKGVFFKRVSEDPEDRVKYLRGEWKKILDDPESSEKFFFGFAYRRWSSFLRSSPIEELSETKARIFIAHGTADSAVDVSSSDTLYSHLNSKGSDVTYLREKGADHSFRAGTADKWPQLHKTIADWFETKKA